MVSSSPPTPLPPPLPRTSSFSFSFTSALRIPTMPSRRPHILPRIDSGQASYSQLGDNGMRRRWMPGWKKIAVVLVVVFGLVALFGISGKRRDTLWGHYGNELEYVEPGREDAPYPPAQEEPVSYPPLRPPPLDEGYDLDEPTASTAVLPLSPLPSSPSISHPTSPETDPNPSGTTYCTTSHNGIKRIVQYALMIDAGSTGSRIHVYKFHNCLSSPSLEYEVFVQSRPGLSSFSGRPEAAAMSLDSLMDEAVRVVPKELQACTPVAVKATAGLRLLGAKESGDILEAVRSRLTTRYPFTLVEKDGVVIMDGKDEGVYAWITANYLLGTIGSTASASEPTYAVLDLGGASTQIVFEPRFSTPDSTLEEGDHKYTLQFAGQTHSLYQHSYLGYGLMRARRSVHSVVGFMWDFLKDTHMESGGAAGGGMEVGNPCLAKGTRKEVELDYSGNVNVTMVGADVGSFESCNRVVELVMAKDALCHVKPCAFNGVYQPSILDTFPSGGILLLSYFYDRVSPLLPPSPSSHPTTTTIPISQIGTLAQQVCAGRSSWIEHFSHLPAFEELLEEMDGRPEWCLDLTFMYGLLRLGYEFSPEREVRLEKKVEGVELGWCLGATIAMLDGELTCRV